MKILFLVLLLTISALASPSLRPQDTSEAMKATAQRASFIFSGTVQKQSAPENSAIVRVDEVLRNAGVVSDVQGKDVVVQWDSPPLKEGEQAVFFTNVAIYGSRLTVREIMHVSSEASLASVADLQVRDAIKEVPDATLEARLAQADLVVLGKVSSVRAIELRQRGPVVSEHDPEWWQATVRVESVEKGQANSQSLLVLFPHSDDIRWFAAPKFKVGQEGVFLLQRYRDTKLKVQGLTALHPQDFQPAQALTRVKRLVLKLK